MGASGATAGALSVAAAVVLSAGALRLPGGVAGGTATAVGRGGGGLQVLRPRALPTAKPFSLPALGRPGHTVSLSAYAGKPVILNFFASWCAPCRHETPVIAHYYRSIHGKVMVIGVDVNDPAGAALALVHADGVTFPVGLDSGASPGSAPTVREYRLAGLPATFFLNAQHRIVKRVIGVITLSELKSGAALIDPGAAGAGR